MEGRRPLMMKTEIGVIKVGVIITYDPAKEYQRFVATKDGRSKHTLPWSLWEEQMLSDTLILDLQPPEL
jgi:hypothetical protein